MSFPGHQNRVGSQVEWCIKPSPTDGVGFWRTVLLVDDEPFILRAMARLLERAAFRAITSDKPTQALEHITRENIDLVFSDMTMPEMNGLELLRAIRTIDATVPTVLMTGCGDLSLLSAANECGASEILLKPFEPPEFVRLVKRLARPRPAPESDCRMRTING